MDISIVYTIYTGYLVVEVARRVGTRTPNPDSPITNSICDSVPPSFCTYILVQLALPYTLSWVIFRLHEFELEPGGSAQPRSIHAPRESNNPFRINPHSDDLVIKCF